MQLVLSMGIHTLKVLQISSTFLEGIYILNHTGISYTIMHFTANLADEEE
jgi:hypothetical protein